MNLWFNDIIRSQRRRKIGRCRSDRQSRRALAGFAIVLAGIAMVILIFFLEEVRSRLQQRYTLYAVVSGAPRLRVGSPVWISGQSVGRVSSLGLLPVQPDSVPAVAVSLEILLEHKSLVRRGSTVRLASSRTIGEKAIDILPGDRAQPMLAPGDTLYARQRITRVQVMANWRAFEQSLDLLRMATRALDPAIATGAHQFARIFTQAEAVQSRFGTLRLLMADGSLDRLLNDSTMAGTMAALGQTAGQLAPAFRDAAGRFADPAMRQQFGQLHQRVDSLTARIQQIRTLVAGGSLPRLRQDSALTRTLRSTGLELDSLIAETRRNPLRYWLGNRGH